MVALLTDGDPGAAPDPATVELLGPAGDLRERASGGAPPRTRARRLAIAVAGLAVALLGVAGGQAWNQDRAAARSADLRLQASRLHLASFQLPSVEVTLRNAGPRDLVLQGLAGAGGAVRPQPGVLPVPVPAAGQVQVRLRFGDRCGSGSAADLVATVRTAAGTQRTLPLALPPGDTVTFLDTALHAACVGSWVGS